MNERMTISDIAGFCPEEAIWKMLGDVGRFLTNDGQVYALCPDAVIIDGDAFLVERCEYAGEEYRAPEQHASQQADKESMVWTLGAITYYMATGHMVFGGHGGAYQHLHPTVPLPVMPKAMQALTEVLHRCLTYHPSERIELKALTEWAERERAACVTRRRETEENNIRRPSVRSTDQMENWPEEMIEIAEET